jgi:prolyl-tRNA synthetase
VFIDKRDRRGGEKNWEWIKKGVPVRIEVGPRDRESLSMMVARRDLPHKEKAKVSIDEASDVVAAILQDIQKNYYEQALAYRNNNVVRNLTHFEDFKKFFTPKNEEKPEIHGGFVLAKWCGDPETEALLEPLKVTIRCLPLEQSGTQGTCILTGRPATLDAIFAKSY